MLRHQLVVGAVGVDFDVSVFGDLTGATPIVESFECVVAGLVFRRSWM